LYMFFSSWDSIKLLYMFFSNCDSLKLLYMVFLQYGKIYMVNPINIISFHPFSITGLTSSTAYQ
jgi:hypothetical protein